MKLFLHFAYFKLFKVIAFISLTVDNHFVESIVNHLFTDGNLGIDLIALNTQRGRDHGLPGYTQYRKACEVGDAKSFDDLASNVSPKNIERLKSVYQNVEDIDLFIGMAAEEPENALVGNTYRCLIADQFARLKKGDRYFYDLEGQAGSFTVGMDIKKMALDLTYHNFANFFITF